MNRMMISIVFVVAACGGKSEDPAPTSGSAPAAGSATAGSAATPSGSAAGSATAAGSAAAGSAAGSAAAKEPEIPTQEDFEVEATARITEKNLDTEVKILEKEIGED